jgi:hypothetical protein
VNYYLLLPLLLSVFLIGNVSDSFAQTESVNVVENKLVTLIGEGYDDDTENLTYLWTQIQGESVVLSSNIVEEPTFMAPDVKNGEIKVLTFELLVTDPQGSTSSDIVEVIVNSVNHIPNVDAGRDLPAIQSIQVLSIIPTVSDADDDKLTYKWEQLSGEHVELRSTTQKHLTFQPIALDYSQLEPITFQLTVDDGFGGVASDTVNVYKYTNQLRNNLFSIEAGPIQTVHEGDSVVLSVTGKALNNNPISYTWIQFIGTPVKLSSFSGDNITFIAPEVGDFEELMSFQVTGYASGSGWANDIALVKVLPSNNSPVADAGKDQHVPVNALVKLEGTGTDPDGDNLRYAWNQKSGLPIELYERSPSSVYFFSPSVRAAEPLVFEFTVTDNHGNSDTDQAAVTITSVNSPPSVFAGPDKRVKGGDTVTVIGSAIDVDGDSLVTEWKQIFGNAINFDKSSLKLSFTAPEVGASSSKRLAFELTATDPYGLRNSDQIIVFVTPDNSAPRVSAGADMTVDENTISNLKCIASDSDGDSLNYSWSTSSNVEIEQSSNPQTSVTIPSVVRDSTVIMTCTVTDGTNFSSDSMNILIKNTLSLDIVSDAGPDMVVNENIEASLDGSKSFDNENQKLYYEWTQISGEKVMLSSSTSVTTSFTSPIVANNEIKVLSFELRVYDDNERENIDTVTITVDPVNSPPTASASAKQ